MDLDMSGRQRLVGLMDHYSGLLTEHQRETLELHIQRDWSYAEIATSQGVSRTAVYDLVHRSTALLEDFERKLGLLRLAVDRRDRQEKVSAQLEGIRAEVKRLEKAVKEMA